MGQWNYLRMKLISAAVARGSIAPGQDRPGRRSRRRPARETAAPAVTPLGGNKTILVVGDTPVLRGVLMARLQRLGYGVVQAAGAVEAQALAETRPDIHVVILDVAAPTPEDLQLGYWFRAMFPRLAVVLACDASLGLERSREYWQELTVLPKPFSSLGLDRCLRRALRNGTPHERAGDTLARKEFP
jgi:DNA-binding NtrC family response regulator